MNCLRLQPEDEQESKQPALAEPHKNIHHSFGFRLNLAEAERKIFLRNLAKAGSRCTINLRLKPEAIHKNKFPTKESLTKWVFNKKNFRRRFKIYAGSMFATLASSGFATFAVKKNL